MSNLKWLRSVYKATFFDKKTDLTFSIERAETRHPADGEFVYRCLDDRRRLLFDRRLNLATAKAVVRSWQGEIEVQQEKLDAASSRLPLNAKDYTLTSTEARDKS